MADERRSLRRRSLDDRLYDDRRHDDRLYDEVKPEGDFAALRRRLVSVVAVLKEFATFCLSQFGLLVLVVSYSLIGAVIFGQLETGPSQNWRLQIWLQGERSDHDLRTAGDWPSPELEITDLVTR